MIFFGLLFIVGFFYLIWTTESKLGYFAILLMGFIGAIFVMNSFQSTNPTQVVPYVNNINPSDIVTKSSTSDTTSNEKIHCDINRSFIDNSVSSVDCK